jgi:hypothetical protein
MARSVHALDWPQWQGPDRNAISKETGLLQEWPGGGPPLAWRVGELGGGDSAPAIADGRILGMSHRGSDDVVWAYRTEEGTLILIEPNRGEYLERGRFEQPDRTDKPAWSHPVIANGRLYVRDQDLLLCYDVKRR